MGRDDWALATVSAASARAIRAAADAERTGTDDAGIVVAIVIVIVVVVVVVVVVVGDDDPPLVG